MCYHTLDALVIQALWSRWICDPTPPRWFEYFFCRKAPKEFGQCLQAQTDQMPLDLRSNDLEARITVASKLREHLMFSHTGEYEVLLHRRFYGDTSSLRSNGPQ